MSAGIQNLLTACIVLAVVLVVLVGLALARAAKHADRHYLHRSDDEQMRALADQRRAAIQRGERWPR